MNSDDELFRILGLPITTTDEELEMTILRKIHQSQNNPKQLDFYKKMYAHFFDIPATTVEGFTTKTKTPTPTPTPTTTSKITLTANQSYSKDFTNPILKQTIKRIVSVDSQYRDKTVYPYATNFSLEFSEPVVDVLSIKLYSIQIPYTWYTINSDYGSNFFQLQATSDGINNGNYDYTFSIPAGNYSTANLITAVNKSIQSVIVANTDISFGNMSLEYDTNTAKATFVIDMLKTYTSSSYQLYFPTTIPSVSSFLGYETGYYPINEIISVSNIPPIGTNSDTTQSIYYLTPLNNYFTIIEYQGTVTNNQITNFSSIPTPTIIHSIPITLSLTTNTYYTRSQLETALTNTLTTDISLSNASLIRTNVDASGSPISSYYTMQLELNSAVFGIPPINSQLFLQFPTDVSYSPSIWTGTNSCFGFGTSYEINQIVGQSRLIESVFDISYTPVYYVTTIQNDPSNVYPEYHSNGLDTATGEYVYDMSFSVGLTPNINYTLQQYVSAINTALTNNVTYSPYIQSPIFAVNTTTNNAYFTVNINKTYTVNTKSNSIPDFSINFDLPAYTTNPSDTSHNITTSGGSLLTELFNLTYSSTATSGILDQTHYIFTGYYPNQSTYSYDLSFVSQSNPLYKFIYAINGTASNPVTDNTFPVYIQIPFNLSVVDSSYIDYTNNKINYGSNYNQFATDIQLSISSYADNYGDHLFSGSTFAFTGNFDSNGNRIVQLTVVIQKTITEGSYLLELFDVTNTNTKVTTQNSSWNQLFGFTSDSTLPIQYDASYILQNYSVSGKPYAIVTGPTQVRTDYLSVTTGINDTFEFIPLPSSDGLTTTTNANNITITIPSGTYTRDALTTELNYLFNANSVTTGTYLSTITNGGNTYSILHININKSFTNADYTLVFYNETTFVKCYVGVTSVKNTVWDATLGWVLGFHNQTSYTLSATSPYLQGDTVVNINQYNSFMIVMDDYNQNRLNDGLVTVSLPNTSLSIPNYASQTTYTCDSSTNQIVVTGYNGYDGYNNLTLNQIYSLNQILNIQQQPQTSIYSTGPFIRDIFGLVPLKVAGLQPGQGYVEFSGTIQNQQRIYFGPVTIRKITVILYTDKGTIVDLNGADWSFSFEMECLYQMKTL